MQTSIRLTIKGEETHFVVLSALTSALFFITAQNALADSTYAQINSSTGSNGSPDAVTLSTGGPIMIDLFGKYI